MDIYSYAGFAYLLTTGIALSTLSVILAINKLVILLHKPSVSPVYTPISGQLVQSDPGLSTLCSVKGD